MIQFWETNLYPFIRTIQLSDIVDIIIVAFILYNVIKFIRQTRAAQLLKGIGILLAIMFISDWFQLNVINFILSNTMQIGATALLIVFQPELRRALEHMGRSKFTSIFSFDENGSLGDMVDEVCLAANSLSRTKTGALLVFERRTKLDDLLTGGTVVNSDISSELLENIFVPNTPLHDGAVVIRDGKIYKAACVLPLSSNKNLSKEFGTRHRAALGISEQSDCVALTVSEETGKISVMMNGEMMRNLSVSSLSRLLTKQIAEPDQDKPKNLRFLKVRGNK
ncbi:MAG: diadenylate cyclase CdaA [Clostridia bacterium]|nr:diadenylate cyclase CdaA [Clostridia bacterium]MBQ3553459.1 diadenylate cyclase CdaA [Clostridia bacterium]